MRSKTVFSVFAMAMLSISLMMVTAYAKETVSQNVTVSIDQVGYRPGDEKYCIVSGDGIPDSFSISKNDSKEIVFTGPLAGPFYDDTTKQSVYIGDFTAFQNPGKYYVKITDQVSSVSFNIKEDVYSDLLHSAIMMLTLQRCGTELDKNIAGPWAHEACHTQKASVYGTQDKRDVSGGWHDAGDYGKYVVPGSKAVADLYLAYELTKDKNTREAILNEAYYELEWMLKMQDEDGGVHHKVSCKNFPGIIMPDEENEELIIAPVSYTATADFIAVMAKAARIYKNENAEFAQKTMEAAQKSWEWLEMQKYPGKYVNPDGINTGSYSDDNLSDEYLWAVSEMFLSGSVQLEGLVRKSLGEVLVAPDQTSSLGWNRVTSYALYDMLAATIHRESFHEAYGQDSFVINIPQDMLLLCRGCLVGRAEALFEISEAEIYKTGLNGQFSWGSNMYVANNAVLLALATRLTGEIKYENTAKEFLHYLLGCNGLGISFVTGYGEKSVNSPHHRPSQATGVTVRGMLVGGPNTGLEDSFAKENLVCKAPALCYTDNEACYSVNEVTIYWNSPLIAILSALK